MNTQDPDPDLFMDILSGKEEAHSAYLMSAVEEYLIFKKDIFKTNLPISKLTSARNYEIGCGELRNRCGSQRDIGEGILDFLKKFPDILSPTAEKLLAKLARYKQGSQGLLEASKASLASCFGDRAQAHHILLKHDLCQQRDNTFRKSNNIVCSEELTEHLKRCASNASLPYFERNSVSRYYFKFKGLKDTLSRCFIEDVFAEIENYQEELYVSMVYVRRDHNIYKGYARCSFKVGDCGSSMASLEENLCNPTKGGPVDADYRGLLETEELLLKTVMYTLLRHQEDPEVVYELLLDKKESPKREFRRGNHLSGVNDRYTHLIMPRGKLGEFIAQNGEVPQTLVEPTEGYRWKMNPETGEKDRVLVPIIGYKRNSVNRRREAS